MVEKIGDKIWKKVRLTTYQNAHILFSQKRLQLPFLIDNVNVKKDIFFLKMTILVRG